jgi:hypothetical protein
MAVRRSLTSLTEEFASMRGVSTDNAVRIALIEAISREEDSVATPGVSETSSIAPEAVPVAEEIVMRRVSIAYMDGQDNESRKIYENLVVLSFFLIPPLVWDLFISDRGLHFAVLFPVIAIYIVLGYFYHRGVTESTKMRSKGREKINNDIAGMKSELPRGLEFLAHGPTFMDVLLSSTESEPS